MPMNNHAPKHLKEENTQVAEYEVYRIIRGKAGTKVKRKYDGCFYRTALKVQLGHVYLLGVEFFGPANSEKTKFEVIVTVDEPIWEPKFRWYHYLCSSKQGLKKYGEKRAEGFAFKNKNFRVDFDSPVYIPEDTWVEIAFHIKSADDLIGMDFGSQKNVASIKTEDGFRKFVMSEGSTQLPIIDFTVKNPRFDDTASCDEVSADTDTSSV